MGVRTAPSTGEVPPIQTAGEGAVLPTETAADQETQQGKLCGNLQKHSAACSVFIFSVFLCFILTSLFLALMAG